MFQLFLLIVIGYVIVMTGCTLYAMRDYQFAVFLKKEFSADFLGKALLVHVVLILITFFTVQLWLLAGVVFSLAVHVKLKNILRRL
jgi:hypothetical protein